MHCCALPAGASVAKDFREETLGATILVTAVTELPLQLPLAQKYLLEHNICAKNITTVSPLVYKRSDLCVTTLVKRLQLVSVFYRDLVRP